MSDLSRFARERAQIRSTARWDILATLDVARCRAPSLFLDETRRRVDKMADGQPE
jgi:hypothetical protein